MRLSLKDAILYGVFGIIFQTYSGMIKIYSAIFILVMLRHIKNLSILKNILLQRYSGISSRPHIIFRQTQHYLWPRFMWRACVSGVGGMLVWVAWVACLGGWRALVCVMGDLLVWVTC